MLDRSPFALRLEIIEAPQFYPLFQLRTASRSRHLAADSALLGSGISSLLLSIRFGSTFIP